jgi:hypothetical protein
MGFGCFVRKSIPKLLKSTLLHLDTVATVRLTPRRDDAIMISTLIHSSCPVCCNRWGFILQYRWVLLKPMPKLMLVGPWAAYVIHRYRCALVHKVFCLVRADAQKFANFVVALQNILLRIHVRTRPFRLFTPPPRRPTHLWHIQAWSHLCGTTTSTLVLYREPITLARSYSLNAKTSCSFGIILSPCRHTR